VRTLTVAAFNAELQTLLESRYGRIMVEGEVSSITVASSGHAYLTLRDKGPRGRDASLSVTAWSSTWSNLDYKPQQGDRVLVLGKVTLYSPRGSVQLNAFAITPAGEGKLAAELARVEAQLEADGLFDERRKRPLPPFPKVIGVATSLTGAALQDFLKVSRNRFPATKILVAGCLVQGDQAPADVMMAIDLLVEDARSEIIVITRGGGSKKDLLAFYDEQLVRHFAACPIPTIAAIGHEVDTSFCCRVADVVASTPSAAAIKALPDGASLTSWVDETTTALQRAIAADLTRRREVVNSLKARLRHPTAQVADLKRQTTFLDERLERAITSAVTQRALTLEGLKGRLTALSPLNVLNRGYAIVNGAAGVIHTVQDVSTKQALTVRVKDGIFDVTVT
jgi:exodeoxyribonuclease VII large subunit